MEIWKKQKKVLVAFGIFLALMLLCTLISRAVYASRLPQITTDKPRKMAIRHRVETEGIVREGREYAVNALAGLRVRTVHVRIGDRVEKDTLLFELDTEDIKEQIQKRELEIQKLKLQINAQEQSRDQAESLKQTQNARAQEDYARADSETGRALEDAQDELEDAEDELERHRENGAKVTSEEERQALKNAYEEWVKKGAELRAAFEQAEAEYQGAKEKREELEQAAGEASDLSELEAAKEAEAAAKLRQEEAGEVWQTHKDNPVEEPDFTAEDEAQKAWEQEKEALKDAVEAAEKAVEESEQSREQALLEAGRKSEDAALPSASDSSLEINRLELSGLQAELEKYKEALKEEGKIYPEREGIVTRIQVSPGERAPDGAAVVCADLTSPMQFWTPLTREQKKYVNQGDRTALTLGGASLEASVDYVAASETNPEAYEAYITLPEGVGTVGQSGDFLVEAQSESFSCCIPIDALWEDSNHKKFVYILKERSGILGTELAAEKVYVKVLDQNESYAAIEEGVIDRETEVILTSTEPLEDRAVVRYRE